MPRGRVYHLKTLFDDLNRDYFENRVQCTLAWGNVRAWQVKRVRQLGRYEPRRNRIVMSPVLDQFQIPHYVIASVLHHEMCHIAVPPHRVRGRTLHHSKAFKDKERQFANYGDARRWIRENRKFLFQPPQNHVKALELSGHKQLKLFSSLPLPEEPILDRKENFRRRIQKIIDVVKRYGRESRPQSSS